MFLQALKSSFNLVTLHLSIIHMFESVRSLNGLAIYILPVKAVKKKTIELTAAMSGYKTSKEGMAIKLAKEKCSLLF